MAQIKNRFEITDSLIDEKLAAIKSLPNFFDKEDEVNLFTSLGGSLILHFLIVFIFWLMVILGITFPRFAMPDLPNRDIEFKLVQTESKPPINKNTKIRSDRDSQAGGKHNPKKAISDPTPKGPKPSKTAPSAKTQVNKQVQQKPVQPAKAQPKQPLKTVQKAIQQVQKPQIKQQQPQTVQKPTPAKPTAAKAPTASLKPAIKPTSQGVAKPSAPKIATAPKSPFAVPVPQGAPSGSTYKPAGSPMSGSSGSSGSKGAGAPAPKFSSSGGKSGSSGSSSSSSKPSSGSYGSRGSYGGGGTGGNPSPGNPKGTPGIDAVKQPNWGPYMRDLEQRIKRNWTPPKGDSSKRVVITFTISRDGRLLNKRIVKSSGVPLADRAAMSAIEQTAPFRPLPPEFKGTSVPIEFTFDYNVLNSVMR